MGFKLPDDLFPFQLEDANKISSIGNALDFSEMGTGKTPVVLQVSEQEKSKSTLIICPNSLRWEWARQIEDWIGEDIAAICTSNTYSKLSPILFSFKNGQRYKIINYEALRNETYLEVLSHLKFDLIAMDEIHKIRNPQTKQVAGSRNRKTGERDGGIWRFLDQHPEARIIGLSGSPIMNYPIDLYTSLTTIRPEEYPRSIRAWKNFSSEYAFWTRGRFGGYFYGARNLRKLQERIAPYTIRRTKKEVLPFLPSKYYRPVLLEMGRDQRQVYDQMAKELKILLDTGEPLYSPSVLAQLTRLRQINLDPKLVGKTVSSGKTDFLLELVESTDKKLVIFSCFEKYIHLLSTILFKNISHTVVTGTTPPDPNDRSKEVKRFQEDPNCRLFLSTIQTGGEGLTLTASSDCILVDRWWNEPTNSQAVDRLHRIGQESPVQVIIPIIKDSVDQLLNEVLKKKQEASDLWRDSISHGEQVVKEMVLEELRKDASP